MKLFLIGHQFQFAIEQTIMAMLPQESIETTLCDNSPPREENTLESVLFSDYAYCGWLFQGHFYEAKVDYTPETLQYALKTAVYQTIVQTLDSKPPWGSLSGVRPVKLATKLLKAGENVQEVLEKQYYLDKERANLAEECAKVSVTVEQEMKDSLSLYVGIPFCPSRCHYCSFFSTDVRGNEPLLDVYLDHLITEIQGLAPLLTQTKISTLYLGGGTPTVLSPSQLRRLLQVLDETLNLSDLLEYTVEAGRPDTIDQEKLQVLEEFAVHRISINPQTMKEETLGKMGREHNLAQIHQAYALAKGKFILNMDLIAGLVEETPDDFLQSLGEIMAMNPEQITVHSLTTKKNTPLQEEKMAVQSLSWDKTLNKAWEMLRAEGYRPYYLYRQKQITQGLENVGWTKTAPSYYNVAMMEEFQSILGFGSGAMTKLVTSQAISRQQNPKYPKEYGDKIHNTLDRKKKILQDVLT